MTNSFVKTVVTKLKIETKQEEDEMMERPPPHGDPDGSRM
jgi:hypothetical protein